MLGGDADVTTLGIEDDVKPRSSRSPQQHIEHTDARRTMALEASRLELAHADRRCDRLKNAGAEVFDRDDRLAGCSALLRESLEDRIDADARGSADPLYRRQQTIGRMRRRCQRGVNRGGIGARHAGDSRFSWLDPTAALQSA